MPIPTESDELVAFSTLICQRLLDKLSANPQSHLFWFLNDVFLFLFRTTFDEHVQLSVRFRKCTCVFECLFVRSNNINNEKKERKRKEEEHIGMSKILEKKKVFFFLVELFKNKKKMLFILNTIESIEVKNRIESSEWEELEEESGFCRLIAIILIEFV